MKSRVSQTFHKKNEAKVIIMFHKTFVITSLSICVFLVILLSIGREKHDVHSHQALTLSVPNLVEVHENRTSLGQQTQNLRDSHDLQVLHDQKGQEDSQALKDLEEVSEIMFSYIENLRIDDPLIEAEQDLWVKKSNVKGIEINGQIYFYSLSPHMSFDPLSREEVSFSEVELKYYPDDAFPVIIYTINDNAL